MNLKTIKTQDMSTSNQIFTLHPTVPAIQIMPTLTQTDLTSPAAIEMINSEYTITTTIGFTATRVTMATIPSLTLQIVSKPLTSSVESSTRHQSSIALSVEVTKGTDTDTLSRTDVSATSPPWLPQTTNHITKTETQDFLPSPTPTADTPNTNADDEQVILVYPPIDEPIKVVFTQSNPSAKLNCTISGSNLTGIEMLWMYNEQPLMNDRTESLNGEKVSYVTVEMPGVYKCIVQSTNGMMDSEIAGVFELSMPGEIYVYCVIFGVKTDFSYIRMHTSY